MKNNFFVGENMGVLVDRNQLDDLLRDFKFKPEVEQKIALAGGLNEVFVEPEMIIWSDMFEPRLEKFN